MERTFVRYVIGNLEELKQYAIGFLERRPRGGVIGLSGNLGAGKTTFVRTCVHLLAERAGITAPRVASPSYTLHQAYPQLPIPIDHFDLYRLNGIGSESLVELGYYETLENSRSKNGFTFVEWPERALDRNTLQLTGQIEITLQGEARIIQE